MPAVYRLVPMHWYHRIQDIRAAHCCNLPSWLAAVCSWKHTEECRPDEGPLGDQGKWPAAVCPAFLPMSWQPGCGQPVHPLNAVPALALPGMRPPEPPR